MESHTYSSVDTLRDFLLKLPCAVILFAPSSCRFLEVLLQVTLLSDGCSISVAITTQ